MNDRGPGPESRAGSAPTWAPGVWRDIAQTAASLPEALRDAAAAPRAAGDAAPGR